MFVNTQYFRNIVTHRLTNVLLFDKYTANTFYSEYKTLIIYRTHFVGHIYIFPNNLCLDNLKII